MNVSSNSSPSGKNGRHFADNIFRCIFVDKKFGISLKFVPKSPFYNKSPSTGVDNGLTPNRRQTIIWSSADQIDWRISAALGRDKLLTVFREFNVM